MSVVSPIYIVTSFLYRKDLISSERLKRMWENRFGEYWSFEHPFAPMKEYYSKEMGEEALEQLERFFVVSKKTYPREEFIPSKKWAMEIEGKFAREGKRTVNIDTGALGLENFILATTKPYSHRIFVKDELFAELTYIFKEGHFHKLDWTYPDYSHPEIIESFEDYRSRLLEQIRETSK